MPAGGPDVYRCFVIPLSLETDIYLGALEFRADGRLTVHHALVFTDSTGQGRKLAANSPDGAAVSIPWLLLTAASTTGSGVFTPVTYVQRLATHGGVAPATGCDSTTVSTDTRIPYSADYYFFTGGNTDGGTNG